MKSLHLGTLALGLSLLVSSAYAQSVSIGGTGRSGSGTPESVEEPYYGTSYTSTASACAKAKGEAANAVKKRANVRSSSFGQCNCSSSKKTLTMADEQGRYFLETGNTGYGKSVDVYQCTVDVRIAFDR